MLLLLREDDFDPVTYLLPPPSRGNILQLLLGENILGPVIYLLLTPPSCGVSFSCCLGRTTWVPWPIYIPLPVSRSYFGAVAREGWRLSPLSPSRRDTNVFKGHLIPSSKISCPLHIYVFQLLYIGTHLSFFSLGLWFQAARDSEVRVSVVCLISVHLLSTGLQALSFLSIGS